MSWIDKHKRRWRLAFLILLAFALSGPWFFDIIWVPPPYICSAPHVRLDENFCGMPSSIIWFFRWFFPPILADLRSMAISLIPGPFILLLVLPFLSIITLIRRGDRRNWRAFHIIVLGLAIAASVFAGLLVYSRPHPALWGLWLYATLAAGMLLLEALIAVTTVTNRRSPRE